MSSSLCERAWCISKIKRFFFIFFSPDHDDEFVSESYQASTEDINEANASMKRLGVTGKKFENLI